MTLEEAKLALARIEALILEEQIAFEQQNALRACMQAIGEKQYQLAELRRVRRNREQSKLDVEV